MDVGFACGSAGTAQRRAVMGIDSRTIRLWYVLYTGLALARLPFCLPS